MHALALAAALASAAGVGFISFLVLYAVESGMSQAAAGLLLVAVSLAATVSRIGVGVFADRRGQEPLRPVAAMLAVSIGGYLLLIAGEPALIVVAALLAGSFGWAWPGGLTLAVVQRSPGAPAWAVGVLMAGLFSGAIAGPLLVGVLAEQEQFALAWSACAALRAARRLHRAGGSGASRTASPALAPVRFGPCSPRSFTTPRTPAEPGPVAVAAAEAHPASVSTGVKESLRCPNIPSRASAGARSCRTISTTRRSCRRACSPSTAAAWSSTPATGPGARRWPAA